VKGNLDAFNQLVMKYQNMAYGHAYALVGDPDTADDITQESFLKAFQNLVQFHGGSFRAWLMRIVTNTSYDLLRSFRKHPTQPLFPVDDYGEDIESISWVADPEAGVETIFDRKQTSERLLQALDELPVNYRSILTLIDLYELDYSEATQGLTFVAAGAHVGVFQTYLLGALERGLFDQNSLAFVAFAGAAPFQDDRRERGIFGGAAGERRVS